MSQKYLLALASLSVFICTAFAAPAPQPAEHHWYQVEMIVFTHINADTYASESWPTHPTLSISPQAISLKSSDATSTAPAPYVLLSKDQWQLKREAHLLRAHGDQVIWHAAWLQPIRPSATTVRFSADNADQSWQLEGKLKLSQHSFFNANTALLLTEPASALPASSGISGSQSFLLTDKRRLQANELNYMDHPLFGVLLKIIPYAS